MMILLLILPLIAAELFRFGPDNHMLFVEAKVADHEHPYLFKIDPSMRYSVVTEILADNLELKKSDFKGNEICSTKVKIDRTSIDGTFFVVQGSSDFPLWGGVLGADVLEKQVIDINLPQNTLSFVSDSLTTQNLTFALSKDGIITQAHSHEDTEKREVFIKFRSAQGMIAKKEKGKIQLDKYVYTEAAFQSENAENNTIGLNALHKAHIILDMANNKISVKKPFAFFPPKRKSYTQTILERYEKDELNAKMIDHHFVAKLYINEEKVNKAIELLAEHVFSHPEDDKSKELLYSLQLKTNQFDYAILTDDNAADFVTTPNWIAIINQLWLSNQQEKALQLAQKATETNPKEPNAWVALSDVYTAIGSYAKASSTLGVAKTLNRKPYAYTVRSTLQQYLSGDKESSISYIRQQLQQPTPSETELYIYTRLFSKGKYKDLFKKDMESSSFQSDFYILALRSIGNNERSIKMKSRFQKDNCTRLRNEAQKNCIVWINAMHETSSPRDVRIMSDIVKKKPFRSDYWDTFAVVLFNLGKQLDAQYAIEKALLYDSANAYMLFQYHWISQK